MRTTITVLVALLPLAARADAIWPKCSRYELEGPGEYCVERPASSGDYGCQRDSANPPPANPSLCNALTEAAQQACCSTWLASGWKYQCHDDFSKQYAVWCRNRQPGDPPPADPPGQEGCAIGRSAAIGSVAGALILALFVVVGLIRRRR